MAWARLEASITATSVQLGPFAATDAIRRLNYMHSVWSVLDLIIARPWDTLLHILVDLIRLSVHVDHGPLSCVRPRLVLTSSWVLLVAFCDHARPLFGSKAPRRSFSLDLV